MVCVHVHCVFVHGYMHTRRSSYCKNEGELPNCIGEILIDSLAIITGIIIMQIKQHAN